MDSASAKRIARAVDGGEAATLLIDSGGVVIYASRASERLLCRAPERVLGERFEELLPAESRAPARAWLEANADDPGSSFVWELPGPQHGLHLEARATNLLPETGVSAILLVLVDRSEARAQQQALALQAMHDDLTGLAGRTLFLDRLEQACRRLERQQVRSLGVVFIDLDHFKRLNEQVGHPLADRALSAVGQRLRDSVRGSDTCARLGGDEFAALIEGGPSLSQIAQICDRIVRSVRAPIQVEGRELRVTCSAGAALGDEDPAGLLHAADRAMYEAKRAGGNRSQVVSLLGRRMLSTG